MEGSILRGKVAAKDMSFTLDRGVCERCGRVGLLVKTARYGNLCADRCQEPEADLETTTR